MSRDGSGPSLSLLGLSRSPESDGDTRDDCDKNDRDDDSGRNGALGDAISFLGAADSLNDRVPAVRDGRTLDGSGNLTIDRGGGGRVVFYGKLRSLWDASVDGILTRIEDTDVQGSSGGRVPPRRVEIDVQFSL